MLSTKSHPETYPILQSTEPTTGRPVIHVTYGEESYGVIPQGAQHVVYVNSAPAVRPETSWVLCVILVLLNVCYLAGGVILPAVLLNQAGTSAWNTALSVSCNKSSKSTFQIGVAPLFYLALVALVGFLAVCTRSRCVKTTYYILHGVLILLFLAFTVMTLVLLSGGFDNDLLNTWNQQVRDCPGLICDLEQRVECNGWNSLCPSQISPASCAYCNYDKLWDTTCHSKLESALHTYSVWMVAGGTLGMVASVVCIVLTGKLN